MLWRNQMGYRMLGLFGALLWGWLWSPGAVEAGSSGSTRTTPTQHGVGQDESLWQTVKQFWGPSLQFVVQANWEFWAPRLRARVQESREFWSPSLQFVAQANREFWAEPWEFVAQANREFWGDFLNQRYFPHVRSQYRFLKFHYGPRISRVYAQGMEYLRPMVQEFPVFLFRESYQQLPSGWKFALEHVPASVKRGFDQYFSWSLSHLAKTSGMRKQLPQPLQDTLQQLAKAMVLSRDAKFNARIQRVFVKVRRFAHDRAMIGCYRVIALQSPVVNAFNTGCTSYVTSGLAELLSDLELAAVLAHELSHGDQGHAVKNLWLLSRSAGEHLYQLMSEEVTWYLTGRTGPALQKVMKQGNVIPILQVFGEKAPAVEIAADEGATRILLRAGISPQHLITALLKLHGKKPEDLTRKDMQDIRALRNYPSLYRRIQAVKKSWVSARREQKP